MAKRRFTITVSGRVQRVGFRDFIAETARKVRLAGEVRNSEDPSQVVIVAEGERNVLNEFVCEVKRAPSPAEIENIAVSEQNPTGEFKFFRIARGEPNEELGERLDVANTYLRSMLVKQDKTLDKQDGTLEKQDRMLEKQDRMLETQDQMLEKQDQMLDGQDKMLEKQDRMLGKQGETVNEIKGTKNEIREMKTEVVGRFDVMEHKYGRISFTLERISDALEVLAGIRKS